MRILYTLNSSKPGGMEQHVLDLVVGLVNKNHQVFVWCPNGTPADSYKASKAKLININIRGDLDSEYILALAKFLREEKIDIIHAHEPKAVVNSLMAAFLSGTKVRISHTHTPISEWEVRAFKKKLNIFVYTVVVNLFSTAEIALTESRQRVKVKEGILAKKLHVFPNGVDILKFNISQNLRINYRQEMLERHQIPSDAFVFGNIGRISEEKGHFVLLDGFSKFLKMAGVDIERVFLVLVGGGKLEASVRKTVEDLGISKNVVVTGGFAEENKVKYYSALNCFVFPSLAEGFGIVLLEAMASSLPILCSDLEVLQEVGDGTALFFEVGNSESLAGMLLSVYQRRDAVNKMGEEALARVHSLYSVEKFVEDYEKFYIDLLTQT